MSETIKLVHVIVIVTCTVVKCTASSVIVFGRFQNIPSRLETAACKVAGLPVGTDRSPVPRSAEYQSPSGQKHTNPRRDGRTAQDPQCADTVVGSLHFSA